MGDLIGKYLLNEKKGGEDLKTVVEEEIDNMEFELSKFSGKILKQAISNAAKRTGLKRRFVKQQILDEIDPDSDLYGILPRI